MSGPTHSASTFLKKIADWDGETQDIDIHQTLTAAFNAPDYGYCIKNFTEKGINTSSYINNLDKVSSCSIPVHQP